MAWYCENLAVLFCGMFSFGFLGRPPSNLSLSWDLPLLGICRPVLGPKDQAQQGSFLEHFEVDMSPPRPLQTRNHRDLAYYPLYLIKPSVINFLPWLVLPVSGSQAARMVAD